MPEAPDFRRALEQFDASVFAARHGGYKESGNKFAREYLLTCPWCASSRLRWHHPGKKGFRCWGCARVGSSIDLIGACEGLTYWGAVDLVCSGYVGGDGDLSLKQLPQKAARTIGPMAWPNGVDVLTDAPMHRNCWLYLHTRGVDPRDAFAWRLGYGRFGKLNNYVIFPVFQGGVMLYWQARACWDPPKIFNAEQRRAWVRSTEYIKSINPPMTIGTAVAGDVLLNYDRARGEPHIVIVEGPFDAIKVGPHAVALLGKVPTDAKIAALLSTNAQRFTIYLDRGEEEAKCAHALATALSPYRPTFIARAPDGYDAGALTPEQNAYVISCAVRFAGASLVGVSV